MKQADSHMLFAIDISLKSENEDDRHHPQVGALLINGDGEVVEQAYRGEFGGRGGQHAEFVLLEKCNLSEKELKHCAIVSTLEPCVRRGVEKTPCANRIIDSGVKAVLVGMIDPNPIIRGNGIHEMQMAGIDVSLSSPSIYKRIYEINRAFIEQFKNTA